MGQISVSHCFSFFTVKEKFGLPDASELEVYDNTDTAVDEDIIAELLESNPGLCLTVRERTSDEGMSLVLSMKST